MAIPKPKKLTKMELLDCGILEKEKSEITMDYVRELFACFMNEKEAKFNTYDKFDLPAGKLYNKETIETTLGRYLCNLVAIPEAYLKKYGYINKPFNNDLLGEIEGKMANMLLNDEMSTKEYGEYLDNGEWLGMGVAYFLCPTMNYDINIPIPEVIAKRDELFEKYKDQIARGESGAAEVIEKEVLALAKTKIKEKGNEAYDFFECGVGKFANNYKKTSIMAGAIQNPYTKKLDILKSNYIDGVNPKEFPKFTNLTIVRWIFAWC